MRTKEELFDVLLATTRMPLVGGDPFRIGYCRYIDGALAAGHPAPRRRRWRPAATHVLVLQTRPYGVPRSTGLADRRTLLIERHLRKLNPALVALWRERIPQLRAPLVDEIRRQSARRPQPPHRSSSACGPPAGTPVVSQLERRAGVLSRGLGRRRAARRGGLRLTPISRPRSPGSRCGHAR